MTSEEFTKIITFWRTGVTPFVFCYSLSIFNNEHLEVSLSIQQCILPVWLNIQLNKGDGQKTIVYFTFSLRSVRVDNLQWDSSLSPRLNFILFFIISILFSSQHSFVSVHLHVSMLNTHFFH